MTKIRNFPLTESFKLDGQWWLPRLGVDSAVGGVLEYEPSSGCTLRLHNVLDAPEMPETGRWSPGPGDASEDLIYGTTFNGPSSVTLEDCLTAGRPFPRGVGVGAVQRQVFDVSIVYMGAWLESADLSFDRIRAEVTGARLWAGASGLRIGDPFEIINTGSIEAGWIKPALQRLDLPDGASAEIAWGSGYSASDFNVNLSPAPHFDFEPSAPVPVTDLIQTFVQPLRDFSTFVLDAPMAMEYLLVPITDPRRAARELWLPVVIRPGFHEPVAEKRLLPLFGRQSIGPLLEDWHRLNGSKYREALWRLLGRRYGNPYLEDQITTIASAFESLSTAGLGPTSEVPAEWMSALLAELKRLDGNNQLADRDLFRMLRVRISAARNPSLRTVIETITNTYHDSYRNLIRDPAAFAVALAGARNRLGHGRGLNSGAQDAFNLVRVAEYVVAAVLAGQLGFEQSEVSESFGRSYRFNSLCRTFQTGDGGHSGPADEEPDAAD